jgi:hypothetical protein
MDDEDELPAAAAMPEANTDRHTKLVHSLFGCNTEKVIAMMKCSDAYAEVFNAANDAWTGLHSDTAYNEMRASRQATELAASIYIYI